MCRFIWRLKRRFVKSVTDGYLPVCDGHKIYYQCFGNPKGKPVLSFHGGPGGSSRAKHAAVWPLKTHFVICFDQRGCGKSETKRPLYKNTIFDTVRDGMRLLDYLGIREKIIVAGGSYGATCAVLFAEEYPSRVRKLVVNSVFLARPQDYRFSSPSALLFYPDVLHMFQKQSGGMDIETYFDKLLFSKKRADNERAVRYWGAFEHQLGDLAPTFPRRSVSDAAILNARIMRHYVKNRFFLKRNQLIDNIKRLTGIPTLIVQNRLDFCCPPAQAYELHRALKRSRLVLVPDSGHGSDMLFYTLYLENKKAAG